MTVPIHVVVPVKDRWDLTERFVTQALAEPIDRLWVFDNGSTDGTVAALMAMDEPRMTVMRAPDSGIYAMWNAGWTMALAEANPVAVAICNNDIGLHPGTFEAMRDALYADDDLWAVYPDWRRDVAQGNGYIGEVTRTEGTYQNGGLCGWCFMLRGEAFLDGLRLIDEGYRWWYGDDDLVESILATGHAIGRLDGLPVDHEGEGTAKAASWTDEAKRADTERWLNREGRVA